MRAFERALGKQDAVIGEDADGIAADMREAAHEGRAVELLELVQLAAVNDAGNDVARVIGPAYVVRDDAVDLFGRIERLPRLREREWHLFHRVQIADDLPRDAERVPIVERVMVRNAGDPAMHIGATQFLGRDDLAGRGLHQGGAAEKDRALALDDDRLVGHRRHIGAARRARAHDDRDLRHAKRREIGLVIEDAAEMLAVGKHLVLRRQKRAAGIDEVEAGQAVVARDLLGAQMLLDGHREIGAALDRRVIGDDDAFAPGDAANAGDDPGRRHRAVIHLVGGKGGEFEKGGTRIEQHADALARQELAAPKMALPRGLVAAPRDRLRFVAQIGDDRTHRLVVGAERLGTPVYRGKDYGHRSSAP